MKKYLLSCKFNIDSACIELKYFDGSMIAFDTIALENKVVNNMYQRSELDYLIYNDQVVYADLILSGDQQTYPKMVTEYKPFYKNSALCHLLAKGCFVLLLIIECILIAPR